MKKTALIITSLLYPAMSAAAIDINQIKSLFEVNDSKAIYDITSKEARNYEGDPVFDYYYGISAIDTGHASEGVFALERVLELQPNNRAARLELARGYFILEEYARARKEFETILELNPPEKVANHVYEFLDIIRLREGRYTTVHSTFVEIGFGHDSNTNGAPSSIELTADFIPATGTLTSLPQKDAFTSATLNYNISSPVSIGIFINGNLSANRHKNKDFSVNDTASYNALGGISFLHAQNTYNLDLQAQRFDVDGQEYRNVSSLNAGWKRNLSQQSTVQVFLQYANLEFPDQEELNVTTSTLGSGFTQRFNAFLSPVLFGNIYVSQDEPELETDYARQNAERDYHGASAGAILTVTNQSSIQVSLSYQSSEYGLENSQGIVREDDYKNLDIDYTWLLGRNLKLRLNGGRTQTTSTDSKYAYDKTVYSVYLKYEI